MKTLQEEAEKYARNFDKGLHGYDGESLSPEDEKQMQDFIAGATSKYVEFEKLKAIIEELEDLVFLNEDDFDRGGGKHIIRDRIKQLEKELKLMNKVN